jgi:hypothetical protein
VQWTRRLTVNQKIAGLSPARINRILCVKDLDMLVWQADQLQLMLRGPVLQWTMRLTMNQKIEGTVNTLTVWVTNCMDTVNTLTVPIQYTFYPPLSSPLPFSSPPSPPSSPTHRYKLQKSERYII